VLALPYGGGGNTAAYARGFREAGEGLPRFLLGEAADRRGTVASAIRIGAPVHREAVEAALAESGGAAVALADDEILAAWKLLAGEEGLFAEPSSAAGVAALLRRPPPAGARVVCVVTGHGLKDPDAVERAFPPPRSVAPDADAASYIRP